MRVDKIGGEKAFGKNNKPATEISTGFPHLQYLVRTRNDHIVDPAPVLFAVHFHPGTSAGTDADHISIHMRGHIMDTQVMLFIGYQEIMDTPVKPVIEFDIIYTRLIN